jgi:hypothetical protein
MSVLRPCSLIAMLLVAVAVASPGGAGNLVFPKEGEAAKAAIAAACPSCFAGGVTLCGTDSVRFGKAFSRHLFAGRPKRGYLPGFRLSGAEFRTLARSLSYESTIQTLQQSFGALPLVVIEAGFADMRVLPVPTSVEVVFPRPLHQCVRDPGKPWGCCIAADCKSECCEKSLGSPQIAVRWDDAASGDTLTFHFSHTLGSSTLARETSAGKKVLYWCIVEEPGWIQ